MVIDMPTTIKFKLSTSGIKKAKAELNAYRKKLAGKTKEFVSKLAEIGVQTGLSSAGEYQGYILFEYEIKDATKTHVSAVVHAVSKEQILRQWLSGDQVKEAYVDPLLMAEFGSGRYASDASGQKNAYFISAGGVNAGRGTFPGQTHAFDEGGWYWQDLNGEWQHSEGEIPTMPVFHAVMEMEEQVIALAREVFRS